MTRPVFRPGLAVAAAAVAATFALPAHAVRQAVPTVKVIGVDSVCDSFTGTCPSFNNTRGLTLNWAAPSRLYTANLDPGSGYGYYPVLQPNTTYYVNIENVENASCAISNACDMFVDLVKPGGL